jgi:hypothetical protein
MFSVDTLDRGSARRKSATYTQDNPNTDINGLSGVRTHDSSVRESLRQRGHRDRSFSQLYAEDASSGSRTQRHGISLMNRQLLPL